MSGLSGPRPATEREALAQRDRFGWPRFMAYECAGCAGVTLAPWNGLPPVGWSVTDHAGRDPDRCWFLCSPRCLQAWAHERWGMLAG